MPARAAVTPRDSFIAAQLLLNTHMMIRSALRAQMRDARLFGRLTQVQGIDEFSGRHLQTLNLLLFTSAPSVETCVQAAGVTGRTPSARRAEPTPLAWATKRGYDEIARLLF